MQPRNLSTSQIKSQQFSFCLWHWCNSFVVGPSGTERSPDGDTPNGICGAIDRKMRIADHIRKCQTSRSMETMNNNAYRLKVAEMATPPYNDDG